jgi:hypothetical protein
MRINLSLSPIGAGDPIGGVRVIAWQLVGHRSQSFPAATPRSLAPFRRKIPTPNFRKIGS